MTGGSGAGVFPSRMWESAPSTSRCGCTFVVMVSEAVAVGTLGGGVEVESPLGPIGGGEGRQSFADKLRCFGACNSDDNGRSGFASLRDFSGEPSRLGSKGQP